MLKAKVWIGNTSIKDIEVGTVEVTNITRSGGRMSSDYLWRVQGIDAQNKPINACGYYVDSYNGSALQCLAEILTEWQSGRTRPIDNHGYQTLPEGIRVSAEELWEKLDREG